MLAITFLMWVCFAFTIIFAIATAFSVYFAITARKLIERLEYEAGIRQNFVRFFIFLIAGIALYLV